MYLVHITLNTGHARCGGRDEVADGAVAAAGDILRRAVRPPRMSRAVADMLTARGDDRLLTALDAAIAALHPAWLDGMPAEAALTGWTLSATAEGRRALIATIWRDPVSPVVTFGVATASRAGGPLWRLLHRDSDVTPIATDPASPPSVPWLATRVEAGAAAQWPGKTRDLMLTADLQYCLAWAWVEGLSPP